MNKMEDDYRAFVEGLFVKRREGIDGFMHAASGLAGERGEVLDLIKKTWVYGKPLDYGKVLEEMGNTLHYFTMMCLKMGVSWEDVIDNNVTKLKKRYPNGYSDADTIARADQDDVANCRPSRNRTR